MPQDPVISEVFTVSRQIKNIAFLKGVGKYCQCGCNKHITGRPDKRFYNSACRAKWAIKNGKTAQDFPKKTTIKAQVNLKLQPDGTRLIKLYLKKNVKKEIKITQSDSELWSELEKIVNFRKVVLTN